MTKKYDFKAIEAKWQRIWEAERLFEVEIDKGKPKFYALIEFPYPSGAGLHVGHPRSFTAMDIISRKRRMEGFNVLFPIGFDNFGLPTENYAIKNGIRPEEAGASNIANFTRQLKSIGFSFAWDRAVITSDSAYYKWTQWMFIQMFKQGLAYKGTEEIWWCPKCKIGITNEELESGRCERCGSEVAKKTKEAWALRMQSYSDKLIEGLSRVDYPEAVKKMQIDWIGRSEGAQVEFEIEAGGQPLKPLEIYTTRPDTIDGVEFMAISPEAAQELTSRATNPAEVKAYAEAALMKTEVERSQEKTKTGVRMDGISAKNPHNGKKVPIYVADYVLGKYGTGAIMAVPDLDERDGEFAAAMGIPYGRTKPLSKEETAKVGKHKVNYKMADWTFSKQRYWGEPIPMIYCPKCGWVPVPEEDLPVKLPNVNDYMPTEDGLSPLAKATDWVNAKCPKCGGPAKRETDTMPTWAGSCWYYLRYMDPRNDKEFASKEALDYWGQVDWYEGGQEHVTRHLLYSRFWHKALYDEGCLPYDEPYKKRSLHGMILAEGGVKMSKSKGNVVNPDDIVSEYGADTLRVYEMFIGPFDQAATWSTTSMIGVHRFLSRAAAIAEKTADVPMSREDRAALACAARDVSERIESMKFNTAVSALMILLNHMEALESVPREMSATFAQLLSPFAPHLADELWERLGKPGRLAFEPWPKFNPADITAGKSAMVVQVNGRKRLELPVKAGMSREEAEKFVMSQDAVKKLTDGHQVKKVIIVPDRIANIVI